MENEKHIKPAKNRNHGFLKILTCIDFLMEIAVGVRLMFINKQF